MKKGQNPKNKRVQPKNEEHKIIDEIEMYFSQK